MKQKAKGLILFGLSAFLLSGCGNHPAFKSDKDRADFTKIEIAAVKEKVLSEDGVASFKVQKDENGIYAELEVSDRKRAKKVADDAFKRLWVETTDTVDLFVKEKGSEDVLIQAFKPEGSDNDSTFDVVM